MRMVFLWKANDAVNSYRWSKLRKGEAGRVKVVKFLSHIGFFNAVQDKQGVGSFCVVIHDVSSRPCQPSPLAREKRLRDHESYHISRTCNE